MCGSESTAESKSHSLVSSTHNIPYKKVRDWSINIGRGVGANGGWVTRF